MPTGAVRGIGSRCGSVGSQGSPVADARRVYDDMDRAWSPRIPTGREPGVLVAE